MKLHFAIPKKESLREAYEAIYTLLGAEESEHFIFTSSGAEAVNSVVMAAYIDVTRKTGKNHYLSSSMGEAPAIMAQTRLQEMGCSFDMVPVTEEGVMDVKSVTEAITPRTALLSCSYACAMTGVVQPIAEIAQLCKERGILFHVDVTHALGKIEIDCPADFLTFDGEQMGALPGTGGILMRGEVEMSPLILGGILNTSALLELGKAAKTAHENRDHNYMELTGLRLVLEERLRKLIPDSEIVLEKSLRLPHIIAFIIPGVTTDALLYRLQREGIFASGGGNHFQRLAFLLEACKIEGSKRESGISFALTSYFTQDEILREVKMIFEVTCELRRYSEHLFEEVL
ncbi:MAG: cysteine desulfurase family protein [Chlamydiales bacterium]